MSIQFERLLPRFILNDKNGYALAKAIERAFELVAQAVNDGIDIIQNPERMPEWRLDEAAREYGILYDYHATIEQKRYWIANAIDLYKIYGTPQAIITFMEGMFSTVEVEENWQYTGGEPFHFRVIVSGDGYDAQKIEWTAKVVAQTKNVRSVLDGVAVDNSAEIIITGEADHFDVPYLYTSETIFADGDYGQEL